jgi:hypothetical protein
VDVEDDFALNEELDIEDEAVHNGVDSALDGVLDGHEGEVGQSRLHGVEDLGQSCDRKDWSRGVVGLGEERFLREGAGRPQEGDGAELGSGAAAACRGRRGVHVRAG